MKSFKCRNCGMDVAEVKTKKGKAVVCEVYWDGETKIYEKNRQPIPHNCVIVKRRKRQ